MQDKCSMLHELSLSEAVPILCRYGYTRKKAMMQESILTLKLRPDDAVKTDFSSDANANAV